MTPVIGRTLERRALRNDSIGLDYAFVYSNALYFEANVSGSIESGYLNFTFSSPVSGEYVQAGVMFGPSQPAWINRGGVRGFDHVLFTDKFSAHTVEGITHVAGVIDRSILEVFANHGQISSTTTFYPLQPLTQLNVAVSDLKPDNATVAIAVYALKSAWREYENEDGIVRGNDTRMSNETLRHRRLVYDAQF